MADIAFTLNGQPASGTADETLLQIAQRHGIEIPHLCYQDGLPPDRNFHAFLV